MTVIVDFKARFPDIETVLVDKYIPILEDSWPCYWGGEYTGCGVEIVLNLLAHLLTQEAAAADGSSDSSKSESSKSVGSVSIGYSTSTPKSDRDEWLKSTSYGTRFLWLTSHNHGGCFV